MTEIIIAAIIAAVLLAILLLVLIWRTSVTQRENRRMLNRLRQNAEQQAQSIQLLSQSLGATAENLSGLSERQDRLRDVMDARMEALQRSSEHRLDQMRETVSDKLDARLTESFSGIHRQLADVNRGLGEMHQLAGEFSDLKKVLGGVKTRGIWGEMQLRALLEQILAPEQYIENAAIPEDSQTRVEFAVRLPAAEGEALLPIDSKFPQEDFLRLVNAAESGDAKAVEDCAKALERALTEQAKLISDKYIRPPQTADFAVMFLPVESLYAEAVRCPGLCERLQVRFRVLVAGPNTLAALLTSLRMSFRTATLEKRASEILALLTDVSAELSRYEEASGLVRRRLDQTADALDALDARARKLNRHLKGAAQGALPPENPRQGK